MLPNWLYTQSLLPVSVAADAADARVPRAEVLGSLLVTPLNGALLRAPYGGGWEQTGRALAALGSACSRTSITFAGHLAEQHRLGRPVRPGLLSPSESSDIGPARPDAPQGYLVLAALLTSAAVGIATTAARNVAPDGATVTAVLTAQASVLRVLTMVDALTGSGKDAGGTVSASFHTVVRGAARMLETTSLREDVFAATGHPVLRDDPWERRVELSLSGDWSGFGCAE